MRFVTFLRLARVSNLPTVWSNVLAASVLAGSLRFGELTVVVLAMSALYMGGMMLNDAFDSRVDAKEQPWRPIPAGETDVSTVWSLGSLLLAAGVALLTTFGAQASAAAVALMSTIILYNVWHKGNPLSPVIMGACRAFVYVGTALAAGAALSSAIAVSALSLMAYVAALTAVAKGGAFQTLLTSWPAVLLAAPIVVALVQGRSDATTICIGSFAAAAIAWAIKGRKSGHADDRDWTVGFLIALIAVVDAVVASAHGNSVIALVCVALFFLTLSLQRLLPGT